MTAERAPSDGFDYPATRRDDVADNRHGTVVADPYRWLEKPDDPEVAEWVRAQGRLAAEVLGALPHRESIRARLLEIWDYPKFGIPFERGGRWFQARNAGLQAQAVIYVADSPDADGRVLLDPNSLSPDGTVAVTRLAVSDDGMLAAYATSTSGSDWMTWRVREVDTGRDRPDVIEWSKFSTAAWPKDGSGFYYGGMERPRPGREFYEASGRKFVAFHRIGTPQSEDVRVYTASELDFYPTASLSDDDRYLIISVFKGTSTECMVEVLDLENPDPGFTSLVGDFAAKAYVITNVGEDFFLLNDWSAERGQISVANLNHPEQPWRTAVPEMEDPLLDAQFCGGQLVCHYLRDAHSVLHIYSLDGTLQAEVPLPSLVSLIASPPGNGTVEGRAGSEVFHFGAVSFSQPAAVWSHNVDTGVTSLVRQPQTVIEPDRFVTEQVFVNSTGGARVPMFLTRARSQRPDGNAPVLLYGYGGFNIPMTPSFSPTFAGWIDRGGVLAVACLRGGGEYGRAWHDMGRFAQKQNVFDDFRACAEWLVSSGWSRPGRIGIHGGSNGGLLVGASITQHPEAFGAAVADVGVYDMLRFHLFTIGRAWKDDYGDPDDPEAFAWLRAYSPVHAATAGRCYPPTLLLTGDHDDRVVPAHSYKFAAALQAAQACDNPVLLRVDTDAGHGQGKPTTKLLDEAADRLAFLDWTLGGLEGSA